MSLVLVTQHCYLSCERVTSIILEESCFNPDAEQANSEVSVLRKLFKLAPKVAKRKPPPPAEVWRIEINYVPFNSGSTARNNNYNNDDVEATVNVTIRGKDIADAFFRKLVEEIRDQSDDVYLDQIFNKIMGEQNVSNGKTEEVS